MAFALSLAATGAGLAQITDPQAQKGRVYEEKGSEINYNGGNQPAGVAAQLKTAITKIRSVAGQAGALQSPMGYDVAWHIFTLPQPTPLPWQKAAPVIVTFGLPEYYFDARSNAIKPGDEAFADISLSVNEFRDTYNDGFDHDIAAAGRPCPIFFFMYLQKTTDSTHDYVEYRQYDDSKPIRVITNGKSIYVPFTQEQYLNYQIKANKKTADDNYKSYLHDSMTIANVPMKKDILKGDMDLVNTWRERMNKHQQQLSALSGEDRKKPAFILYGANATADNLQELTTDDDQEGRELWTVNPDYFNKSLPPSAIQVIVVHPEHAGTASGFIRGKVMDAFGDIDYKALRALIQN